MNKKDLKKILKKLLVEKDRAVVISISGNWGVGKTYFWKNLPKII